MGFTKTRTYSFYSPSPFLFLSLPLIRLFYHIFLIVSHSHSSTSSFFFSLSLPSLCSHPASHNFQCIFSLFLLKKKSYFQLLNVENSCCLALFDDLKVYSTGHCCTNLATITPSVVVCSVQCRNFEFSISPVNFSFKIAFLFAACLCNIYVFHNILQSRTKNKKIATLPTAFPTV